MASLKDIRRRISSVSNTQQITKAMKMVAAAKLRRAQDMISGAKPFANKIEELALRLVSEITSQQEEGASIADLHPLLRNPEVSEDRKERVALLVVSSDKGLCGAYNTNAIKATQKYLKENTDVELKAYFFGKKAYEPFKRKEGEFHWDEDFWATAFSRVSSDPVAEKFMEEFSKGEVDRVDIIYTEFQSALAQVVQTKTLLPMGTPEVDDDLSVADSEDGTRAFVFKPSKEELLRNLLPAQVKTQFFKCFADSLASEFGSRMTSMDNASRNAADMISDLTLQANRVRQAAITGELMEIIGGAEALKG